MAKLATLRDTIICSNLLEMKSANDTSKHVSNQLLVQTIKERKWSEAQGVVYNDASYASIKDPEGFLPLHLAVKYGGTPELVVLIIKAYPKCVQERDPDGNLPLHLAAYHHKGRLWINISEMTTIVFSSYPEAIRMGDKYNNLTIHIALRHRAPDELVRFLLNEYPESAKVRDKFGNLPLHLAIQFQASYTVVSILLTTYSEALKLGNARGSLPLHKATQFDAASEVFDLVLQGDPSATSARDDRGNLPLHLLFLFCAGPPTEERLRKLLQHNPSAVGTPNNDGCIPFAMMNRPQDHYTDDYK